MTDEKRTCDKCGGGTEAGFLVVLAHSLEWVKGGGNVGPLGEAMNKLSQSGSQPRLRVVTHRCVSCGHLELSAFA